MDINIMDVLDIIPQDTNIKINFGNDYIKNKFKVIYDLMLFHKDILKHNYYVVRVEYIDDYYDIHVREVR